MMLAVAGGGLLILILAAAVLLIALAGAPAAVSVPTPQDAAALVTDTTTITATGNSANYDMGVGFDPTGIGLPVAAVTYVTAIDLTSGNETYSHKLQESDDGATNWTDCSMAASVTVVGTAFASLARGFITKRYVREAWTIGGTTPSITYKTWLNFDVCPD